MKKIFFTLFFIAFNIAAIQLAAQTDSINKIGFKKELDTTVVSGRNKNIDTKKINVAKPPKRLTPVDSEFVINNKRLKYYNNWLTVGAGEQQNLTYKRGLGFVGGVDLNIHIKQYYFQLGTMISGEKFGYYNDYQFHLCYGKRFENKDFQYSAFAGIAYSSGYGKVGDTVYTRKFTQPGLYIDGEVIKKIAYDVGIGLNLYADWNQEQTIIGLRVVVYFSGAYLGKKYAKYEDN